MKRFTIGQTVWFKLKSDNPGLVTGILQRATGIIYLVTWSADMAERYHAENELTEEKSFHS